MVVENGWEWFVLITMNQLVDSGIQNADGWWLIAINGITTNNKQYSILDCWSDNTTPWRALDPQPLVILNHHQPPEPSPERCRCARKTGGAMLRPGAGAKGWGCTFSGWRLVNGWWWKMVTWRVVHGWLTDGWWIMVGSGKMMLNQCLKVWLLMASWCVTDGLRPEKNWVVLLEKSLGLANDDWLMMIG